MSLQNFLESRRFEVGILILIVINAITLGLETDARVMQKIGPILLLIDKTILAIFTIEVTAKLFVYRLPYFKDPWRIFDFIIVGICLIPATGNLSVLRALRILRVMRLINVVPSLRKVVGGLIKALPGMGSITILLCLFFYVFAVMATNLYGESFPDWFGSIGESAYSLFQIMTLESWSMGIVRPVMAVFPYSWVFFIVFILCTSFTVLNLFIGVVVSAMQAEHEDVQNSEIALFREEQQNLLDEVRALRDKLDHR